MHVLYRLKHSLKMSLSGQHLLLQATEGGCYSRDDLITGSY